MLSKSLIFSSEIRNIVNLCLLFTTFTFLFLRFVFSLNRIGSDSVPITLARHSNILSSKYGAPFRV